MPKASYHGYAVTDCYKIDPRYGTNEEYVQYVRNAHDQGLKVVQDIVLNHWGSWHHLFLDQPAKDWFHASDVLPAAITATRPSTTRTARSTISSSSTAAGSTPRCPT